MEHRLAANLSQRSQYEIPSAPPWGSLIRVSGCTHTEIGRQVCGPDLSGALSDNVFRKLCAGDDGGLASATVGYAIGAYPWSHLNFLYTWRSAMNDNIAPHWPHLGYHPIWIMWN